MLTQGGAEPLLTRLVRLPHIVVAGLFVETERTRRRSPLEQIRRSIDYDGVWPTVAKLVRRVTRRPPAARRAGSPSDPPHDLAARLRLPVHRVTRYTDETALSAMAAARPDLGITWGTGILPPRVFDLPRYGTINLHQGHTPYYRGGPSVFWELYNGESQVGLTIHHVAASVDAGDVILQTLVPLDYDYDRFGTAFERFLDEARTTLRERGADLMAEAVRRVADGTATRQPQDVSLGRRYRLPTRRERDELRRRLRARVAAAPRDRALRGAPLRTS